MIFMSIRTDEPDVVRFLNTEAAKGIIKIAVAGKLRAFCIKSQTTSARVHSIHLYEIALHGESPIIDPEGPFRDRLSKSERERLRRARNETQA